MKRYGTNHIILLMSEALRVMKMSVVVFQVVDTMVYNLVGGYRQFGAKYHLPDMT